MNAATAVLMPVIRDDICEDEFIRRARALVPVLRERSDRTNAGRRVPRETIDAFRDAGFFRLLQPKRYGGLQTSYRTFTRVLEELGRGCGSSAWVCSVLGEHPMFVSWFSDQAQRDVWGDDPDARVSASFAPRPVQPAAGGYRVTGSWSFSSGCDHAQWAYLGAVSDRGMMYMLVPMTDIEIVDDWHVLGLRGTGSKTLKLADVFVPEHRTILAADIAQGGQPGATVDPGNYLTRSPATFLPAYSLPSVTLGLASRALELFVEAAPSHMLFGQPIIEQQVVQADVAEISGELNMVRLLLKDGVETAVAELRAGKPIAPLRSVEPTRDLRVAAHRLLQIVMKLCAHSNPRWVMDGHPMQLIFRDVTAASAHRGAFFDFAVPAGRAMFGLQPSRMG